MVVILCLRALPQRGNANLAAREETLVAATTMSSGTLLRAKDVVWQALAGTAEPGQIVRAAGPVGSANSELDQPLRAEVYGAVLRNGVKAGEPIRRGAIVKPGDRDFLQTVLFSGTRAIAIPVATGGASTGLLFPGDRVDVILTQTFKNDPPLSHRSVSETVVENLRVLAIDPLDTKPSSAGSSFGRTVTLEVTPEQAEKINVATELGKLSLTLRGLSSNESLVASTAEVLAKTAAIKPIWAGDVSPALGDAVPHKVIAVEQPSVEVIHGTKAVAVKPQ